MMRELRPKGKIVVVGSLNMDLSFYMPRIPEQGETIHGFSFMKNLGGKGANQAVAAARLGASVSMIGCVGDDLYGEQQLETLKKEQVDTKFIAKDYSETTGVASIWKEADQQNRIVVVPGANYRLNTRYVTDAMASIPNISVVLLQLEIPLPIVEAALAVGRAQGAVTILNPAPAHGLTKKTLRLVDILTPNESEAATLSGVPVTGRDTAAEAGKSILESGPKNVIVTMGAAGSIWVSREGIREIPPFKVNAVDSVGAGDAYNGALAFAVSAGLDIYSAARVASYAAAQCVTRHGAQDAMPTLEEVAPHIQKQMEDKIHV